MRILKIFHKICQNYEHQCKKNLKLQSFFDHTSQKFVILSISFPSFKDIQTSIEITFCQVGFDIAAGTFNEIKNTSILTVLIEYIISAKRFET